MTIALRHQTVFYAPNVWDRSPVIHGIVDATSTSHALVDPGWMADQYRRLALEVHEGASLRPLLLEPGADPGSAIARTALDLQRVAGVPVTLSFGRQRPSDDGFDVVVQHRHADVGLLALRLALDWMSSLLAPGEAPFDLVDRFARFAKANETYDGGVTGRALAAAAERRGIPLTFVDTQRRYLELGDGYFRKRFSGTWTSSTPAIASELSRNKDRTKRYLRAAGLPVPEGAVVHSLDRAFQVAHAIGYPVALKPVGLAASIGVSLDLRTDDEVRAAFDTASTASGARKAGVLVERFVIGHDYRALIVGDRIVAMSRRIPPQVVGDGRHTIGELIEIENTHPRRGTASNSVYRQIAVDARLLDNLARAGLSLDDIPPKGREITLIQSGHRRYGAIHVDVTDAIHPVNAALLRTATHVIGLDVAGIDLVAPDISQPIWETGGAIIEVNDMPAFNLHLFPGAGAVRDPGPAIMEMLYPPGQPVRVPLIAVSADKESGLLCDRIARGRSASGRATGLATRDGVTVDGVSYQGVDGRNPAGPRTLLNNPTVQTAIVEVDAQSIVQDGLGFDRCDIAVIRSLSGLETPFGQPVEIVILRALDPYGVAVLDGSDPLVRGLASEVPGRVIWIGLEPDDTGLPSLLEGGNRAIVTRETPTGLNFILMPNAEAPALLAEPFSERDEGEESPPVSMSASQAARAAALVLDQTFSACDSRQ